MNDNHDWLDVRANGTFFCWLSGATESVRPEGYYGPWKLQIAHIASGGARAVRTEDRRAVVLLSPIAHECHVSDSERLPEKTINGVIYPTIDERHTLFIKKFFDAEYYDRDYLQSIWIGRLPAAASPPSFWLEQLAKNQGVFL